MLRPYCPLLLAATASLSLAAPSFEFHDLGAPDPESNFVRGAINNLGTVALTVELPIPEPEDGSPWGWHRGYVFQNGTYTEVPTPQASLPGVWAEGLSDEGVVAGWAYYDPGPGRATAFTYTIATQDVRDLGVETGHYAVETALGVNNLGHVRGLGANLTEPWLFDDGVLIEFWQVYDQSGGSHYTADLNNLGQVLIQAPGQSSIYTVGDGPGPYFDGEFELLSDGGLAVRAGEGSLVFRQEGQGWEGDEREVPLSVPFWPSDVNDHGHVVGGTGTAAAWFDGEDLHNLNDLVPAGERGGWTLQRAFGINDLGQIVGVMINDADEQRLFLLDPGTGFTMQQDWVSREIVADGESFTVEFDVTPIGDSVNASAGLSHGPADAWGDFATMIRFAPNGYIDARNGYSFNAANPLMYVSGLTYHVTMEVDLAAHRYSATVTPAGSTPVVIANNYAFRGEQSNASQLDTLSAFGPEGVLAVRYGTSDDGGSEPPDDEVVSADTWENIAIGTQDENFTLSYVATPSAGNVDAVTGLALGEADWWTDLGLTVRFAPSGFVDARNGGSYAAANTLAYQAGQAYAVTVSVDFDTHTYSATVAPEGGTAVVIADDYAFRTEHASASAFDTLTLHSMHGALAVRDVELGAGEPEPDRPSLTSSASWENADIGSQTGTFTVSYEATPLANQLDAVTGVALGAADWWTDLVGTLRFAPSGFVDARNAGAYQAASTLSYTANTTYLVELSFDVPNRRYSATVTPEGGAPVVIADNYAFRSEHSSAVEVDTFVLYSQGGDFTVSELQVE